MVGRSMISVPVDKGKVDSIILLTIMERHPLCQCSWSYDRGSGKSRLKYQNSSCLANHWHRMQGHSL